MKTRKKLLSIVVVFLIATSALSTLPHQARSATSGRIGYWEFDEGSGTLATDSSGNSNTGTLKNGPQWVSGVKGNALSFDGSDDSVSIHYSPSLNIGGNQISVEFWMKPTVDLPYPTTNGMDFFDHGDSYVGWICVNATDSNYGKCVFTLPNSPYPIDVYSTTNSWASDQWYYLAFTYDGSHMRLYVNGVLENTIAKTGNVYSSGFPLSIGSYCLGTFSFFKGTLDEFAIYDYARTSEDISNYYNSVIGNTQSPIWTQWWFWAIIALVAIAVVLAFTTVHYRKKPAVSKETSVMQSKTAQKANKVCPKCGANLPADSKFCGKCGTSLE